VLDGLEGAMSIAGGAFDRAKMQSLIAGLGKRVFLLHNIHEDAPEVFETRWAMSYLRGPLTRTQIRALMADRRGTAPASAPDGATVGANGTRAPGTAPGTPAPGTAPGTRHEAPGTDKPAVSARWVLPPNIPQYFAPAAPGAHYVPMIVGAADVRFTDSRLKIDETRQLTVVTPLTTDAVPVDWGQSEPAAFEVAQLSTDMPDGATFDELAGAASKARNYAEWTRAFVTWVSTSESLDLRRSPSLKLVSTPGESEGDFRARLTHAAREQRDAAVTRLRQKYAPKVASLQEKLRRAEHAVAREEEQASAQKTQTAISIGTTVLGALFGRKTLSTSTLGRATTAARGMGRASKEAQDIARAKENVAAVKAQLDELEATVQAEVAGIEATWHPATEPLETLTLKPKRTGVHVRLVALVWVA
jgi:hypothetical protein